MTDTIPIKLGTSCMLYTLENAKLAGDGDLIKGIKFIKDQFEEKGVEEVAFYKEGTRSAWKLLQPNVYDIEFHEIPGTEDENGKCAIERRLANGQVD